MIDKWLDLFTETQFNEQSKDQACSFIPLTAFIEGYYLENCKVFVREKSFDIKDLYAEKLDYELPMSLRKYAKIFLNKELNPENILFVDTETTGLSRAQGTFVFMLGIGQILNNRFIIRQFFIEEMCQESYLYDYLEELFSKAELFVSYNGKAFDIPLLQSRLILQRKALNLRIIPHLDLLPIARRLWKTKVESFSLASMEYHLLKKMRESEFDIPGYMIPGLYADYQQKGNPEKLISVFYHNDDDISSLFSLFGICLNVFKAYDIKDDSQCINLLELGRLYEQINELDRALSLYEIAYKFNYLNADYYLAKLYKKTKQPDKAFPLWKQKADINSLIELSIYEERRKHYSASLVYTKDVLHLMEDPSLFKERIFNVMIKRKERLESKIRVE